MKITLKWVVPHELTIDVSQDILDRFAYTGDLDQFLLEIGQSEYKENLFIIDENDDLILDN